MTEGLTKLPRTETLPAVLPVPAVPAMEESWRLTPPPPNYFYAYEDGAWQLKKYNPPLTGGGGSASGWITVYISQYHGVMLSTGDTVKATYKKGNDTYVAIRVMTTGGTLELPLPPDDEWELFSISIWRAVNGPVPEGTVGTMVAQVPAPAQAITFAGVTTYSNGYPTVPGKYLGTFLVPSMTGGYQGIVREYEPNGPNGVYIPVGSVVDPAGITTQSEGVRAVKVAATPAVPGIPGQPRRTVNLDTKGWDAGANSIAELDGDVYVKFEVPVALGVRVGFFSGVRNPANVDALLHSFYVYTDAAGKHWSIVDHGRQIQLNGQAAADTVYEIRRYAGQISYLVNNVLVWRSPNLSQGPLSVGTTMYAPGDMVL